MKVNTALGLLTGLAAGFVLGVLYAPAPGEENRKKLKKAADDVLDKVKFSLDPEVEEEDLAEEEEEEAADE